MSGNGTIHPTLKVADFYYDGERGLRLIVHTSDSRVEVKPISPARASEFMRVLCAYAADALKEKGPAHEP